MTPRGTAKGEEGSWTRVASSSTDLRIFLSPRFRPCAPQASSHIGVSDCLPRRPPCSHHRSRRARTHSTHTHSTHTHSTQTHTYMARLGAYLGQRESPGGRLLQRTSTDEGHRWRPMGRV
ncbi:hypothetical protein CDEST_06062 [Colletotrichum destructivum]|uniref:Uncharacterized protein n=1 Tax=Colletotrichum destructivum TaxID=34406 RepID=A0AAX4ICD6_9PEZI|nr:hypothetical protein CDEST_06062 [Colletotrichum destructivum]